MDTSKLVNITSLVGLTIKLERVKNKWSQEELAFKADLNKNSIGAIERGAFGMTFFEFIDLVKLYNK